MVFILSFASLFATVETKCSLAQQPFPTNRGDNSRDGANIGETLLTPANVNINNFGHYFSVPLDYIAVAQPLYMPAVTIPGQGTHNLVYAVTQADSVYAIDADNGTELWYASMLNGGTTASGTNLPCQYGGFHEEGIISTPVIDTASNTMYLVAKTVLNGLVRHDLHALDIATGSDLPGSPVQIAAQSVSKQGNVTVFNSLHQKNRPAMLLLNGSIYVSFGSNGCNDDNSGWLLGYNEATLAQTAIFNTSPDNGLTSIWQAGNGPAADEAGNIYFETAEASINAYDVPNGGQTYCNSVVKLSPGLTDQNNQYEVADFFTPWNVAYLNTHDFDMSSTGAVVLPDQPGPYPHELIASGKQGCVYVLNRDNMGMYSPTDDEVLQEFALKPGSTTDVQLGSSAYWNNTVYFAPDASPIKAYPILPSGLLGVAAKTKQSLAGSHSPSISANGNSNGVLWVISGLEMMAFDAVSLQMLYSTAQAPKGRDTLPPVAHFVTQTVANGKVYVATQNSLEAYGLYQAVTVTAGNAQSGPSATPLPLPLQINIANPYNGHPAAGLIVTFSDGCIKAGAITCGSFNPSAVVTDANGNAASVYTLPQKAGTYTLTFNGTGLTHVTATATGVATTAIKLISASGAKQTGVVGSILPKAITASARDSHNNGVAGVTVNFSANNNGIVNPTSVVTGASGLAST